VGIAIVSSCTKVSLANLNLLVYSGDMARKQPLCKQCQALGQKTVITAKVVIETKMKVGYYHDQDGVKQTHNPNLTVIRYDCVSGHHWEEVSK
jgi:hypothetical protein